MKSLAAVSVIVFSLPLLILAQEGADSITELKNRADEVVADSVTDFITAAKSSSDVFAAAHAFEKSGNSAQSLSYFESGLRLAPWNLEEQLAYAKLKKQNGSEDEAISIARMVLNRTESDDLAMKAVKFLGQKDIPRPPLWDGKKRDGAWLCFVKIGKVNEVMLHDTLHRIEDTLGLKSLLANEVIALPRAGRSALSRFVSKELIPRVRWSHPFAEAMLESLGVRNPEAVEPRQLVEVMIKAFRSQRMDREADDLQQQLKFYLKCDQQWKSDTMLSIVRGWADSQPELNGAIVIGITEGDLYEDNVNYLFGIALTGGPRAVASTSRFRADLAGEPPDRKRLVARLHRQLLSSIGFCLNVPRATDPTSARSYPASVAEQDAKSEFMSEACITGFAKALGQKLPQAAHAPEFR